MTIAIVGTLPPPFLKRGGSLSFQTFPIKREGLEIYSADILLLRVSDF